MIFSLKTSEEFEMPLELGGWLPRGTAGPARGRALPPKGPIAAGVAMQTARRDGKENSLVQQVLEGDY